MEGLAGDKAGSGPAQEAHDGGDFFRLAPAAQRNGALRRRALAHTELGRATCGTIRTKLLKIGALVTVSVRRVRVAMASACPYAAVFRLAQVRLCG